MGVSRRQEAGRIPVHIISGFLGVGKTTTILSLLERLGRSERSAVLVNEWGEVGVDGPLIASERPGIQVREVSGGCICCTAGSAFDRGLAEIVENIRPDRIFVEPSGLAKPGEIIDLIKSHGSAHDLEIRPVIGLVDPSRFLKHELMALPVFRDQLEASTILAANRCDRIAPDRLEEFIRLANRLYPPKAAIYTVCFGALPIEALNPLNGSAEFKTPEHLTVRVGASEGCKHSCFAGDGWTWHLDIVFSREKLEAFFRDLTQQSLCHIQRVKGVFRTNQGWRLMELVGGDFHQRETQYRGPSRCQLILSDIEKPLSEFQKRIESCMKRT